MNIFENITKEKFIEQFNKQGRGYLSPLHLNLAFDYVILKKRKKRNSNDIIIYSITDVKNYKEEIELFNSFEPFVEYRGNKVLIMDNYNKYLSKREKLDDKLTFEYNEVNCYRRIRVSNLGSYKECERVGNHIFETEIEFNEFVKEDNIKKLEKSNAKEFKNSIKDSIKEQTEKILLVLEKSFIEFNDKGYKTKFIIKFTKFEDLKRSERLTKNHLIKNDYFDEFTLELKRGNLSNIFDGLFKATPFDSFFSLFEEYFLTIKDVGEYFEYDIIVNNFVNFTFKKKQT